MSRLERWTAWVIAECPDPGQQQQLYRYAVWHVTRRLRARLGESALGGPPGARRATHRWEDAQIKVT